MTRGASKLLTSAALLSMSPPANRSAAGPDSTASQPTSCEKVPSGTPRPYDGAHRVPMSWDGRTERVIAITSRRGRSGSGVSRGILRTDAVDHRRHRRRPARFGCGAHELGVEELGRE